MSQQINVFGTGWVSLDFHTGLLFPSDRMLVELLRPKIDPMTATLQWIGLIAAEQIPDLGSQLLLQAYSNDIISIIRDEQKANGYLLDKLSIEQGLNRWQSRYHQAVMMYVGVLFPAKIQNLGKFARATMQMTSTYIQYRSGNVLAVGNDCENLVGFDFNTDTLVEDKHKVYLRQRFLEYRIADDYMNALWTKATEDKGASLLEYLKQQQEQRDYFERNRRNSYRQRVRSKNSQSAKYLPLYILRQCPYCDKYYEQKLSGNGSLTAHCKQCFNNWNTARRKVKTQPNWIEISKQRKPCKLCGKKRLVNSDCICKLCFSEMESQSH